MKKVVLLTSLISLCLTSCGRYSSLKSLDDISLLMSKEEVICKMPNGYTRGSMLNKYGQVIEVREYQFATPKDCRDYVGITCATVLTLGLTAPLYFASGPTDTYWLYFCDGKLVQWGRAGDWAEAQKMIYDINFNVSTAN